MPHDRPVRFWDHGHHYFGYRISSLPARYIRRTFWGIPYYIVDGVYYRYYSGSYYVSRPPFGVVFTPTVSLVDAICSFAFYADAYYTFSTVNENANLITEQNRIIAENNATIAAQNATIAQQNATIAAQNATIAANAAGASSLNSHLASESSRLADRLGLVQSYASVSDSYYYDDGIFFTKNKSGEYVTIVPPAGALITELPDDYRIVTLGGDEYYAVDDTVYRTTVIDGSVYFEVLGQMTGEAPEEGSTISINGDVKPVRASFYIVEDGTVMLSFTSAEVYYFDEMVENAVRWFSISVDESLLGAGDIDISSEDSYFMLCLMDNMTGEFLMAESGMPDGASGCSMSAGMLPIRNISRCQSRWRSGTVRRS